MAILSAEVEELETAFAVVDVADLSDEDEQTFATEAQKVVGAIAAKGRGRGKGGSGPTAAATVHQRLQDEPRFSTGKDLHRLRWQDQFRRQGASRQARRLPEAKQ
eukprot:8681015-Pyramimonas_sp.AAC.1